jgi:HEAT repeat protein
MTKEAGLGDTLTQGISTLLESFSGDVASARQGLSQMLATDPRGFGSAALQALAIAEPSAGTRYLVQLLAKEKLLPAGLLDSNALTLEEAVAILQAVTSSGTNLQPLLELALNRVLVDQPNPENTAKILRLLGLLASIAAASSWNAFQLELMAYPDRFVRSRAALLIGRSTKNVAWIGRRFLDRDPRVQASAVEALWAVDAAEARPLLLTASKSQHNRVAANAALGLYRIAELKAIPLLLDMARQADESFQISAYWALGETKDPRFVPFLMDQFKTSQGRIRLAVTRALACIRRQEKTIGQAGEIRIRVSQAYAGGDGARSIALVLASTRPLDLASLKVTEFALWENGSLIEDYEVKLPGNLPGLTVGFVAARFASPGDPYAQAVTAGLERASARKRPDDSWRIDRYSTEPAQPAPDTWLPYDDAISTPEVKARQCFIAAPDLLSQAISLEVPVDRTAQDSFRAIERLCTASRRVSGKRHVFVFLHHDSITALEEEAHLRILKELVTTEKIVFHGFAPGPAHACPAFRDLCLSVPDGTFSDAATDALAATIAEVYESLMSKCEINYRLPQGVETGPVLLKVSSALGAGQADITLQSSGSA